MTRYLRNPTLSLDQLWWWSAENGYWSTTGTTREHKRWEHETHSRRRRIGRPRAWSAAAMRGHRYQHWYTRMITIRQPTLSNWFTLQLQYTLVFNATIQQPRQQSQHQPPGHIIQSNSSNRTLEIANSTLGDTTLDIRIKPRMWRLWRASTSLNCPKWNDMMKYGSDLFIVAYNCASSSTLKSDHTLSWEHV